MISDAEMKQIERASDGIDRFIEQRAREREEADERPEAEAALVANYHGRKRADHRREWAEHHRRMIRVHEGFIEEHRTALFRVLGGRAG